MKRKFNVGDVIFKIVSGDEGGATVERHGVIATGSLDLKDVIIDDLGNELIVYDPVPIIRTNLMGDTEVELEFGFLHLYEVPLEINKFLNKKKLW